MATLAAFPAQGIIDAIAKSINKDELFEIYLSGGGMHNPLLIKYIEDYFGRKLKSTAALGIHPDAKEAVFFALLANKAFLKITSFTAQKFCIFQYLLQVPGKPAFNL